MLGRPCAFIMLLTLLRRPRQLTRAHHLRDGIPIVTALLQLSHVPAVALCPSRRRRRARPALVAHFPSLLALFRPRRPRFGFLRHEHRLFTILFRKRHRAVPMPHVARASPFVHRVQFYVPRRAPEHFVQRFRELGRVPQRVPRRAVARGDDFDHPSRVPARPRRGVVQSERRRRISFATALGGDARVGEFATQLRAYTVDDGRGDGVGNEDDAVGDESLAERHGRDGRGARCGTKTKLTQTKSAQKCTRPGRRPGREARRIDRGARSGVVRRREVVKSRD